MSETPPEYLTLDGVKWEIAYKGEQGDKMLYYLKSLTPEPKPEPPNPYTLTQSEFEVNKSAQLQALSAIAKVLAELACKLPPPTNSYESSPSATVFGQLSGIISTAQNLANVGFYPMQPPKTPTDSQL